MAYPTSQRVQVPGTPMGVPEGIKRNTKSSRLKSLVTLVVVLVILGLGVYALASYTGFGLSTTGINAEWQAVFLGNGQVYFGKVSKLNSDFISLKDIYYLQVVNKQDTIGQPTDVQQQPEQQLTLIKLGNEIHGPKDEMLINRDQVVLIEDLKNDSRVVTAINDYVKSQAK